MTGIGTFFGIEIARRGMKVHQHALNITGHNLANASTPGYSRQEALIKVTNPYTNPSFNSSATPGQFGTGVHVDKIRRIKDEYLDNSVRQSLTANGYWQDQINFLQRAEAVFAEPATAGMAGQITEFFKAWMTLNNTPQDPGAKAVVVEYGQELAFMMTTAYKQLGDVRDSIVLITENVEDATYEDATYNVERGALVDQVDRVNELLAAIADIDKSIKKIYDIGQQPNDLLDRRDGLLEQLSHYVPVEVTFKDHEGLPGEIAELRIFKEKVVLLESGDGNGAFNKESNCFYLSLREDNEDMEIVLNYGNPDGTSKKEFVNLTEKKDDTELGGSLIGLEKARQNLIEYQQMLDDLCVEMKTQIALTMAGKENFSDGEEVEKYFFTGSLADGNFGVGEDLHSNPNDLQGERAGEVASLRDEKWRDLQNSTFEEYYGMLVSKVGSGVDSVSGMAGNHQLINKQITALRDSVSGVNVDEELTRMIQFQYGFQASARVINTMDGMLDVIINRMF